MSYFLSFVLGCMFVYGCLEVKKVLAAKGQRPLDEPIVPAPPSEEELDDVDAPSFRITGRETSAADVFEDLGHRAA